MTGHGVQPEPPGLSPDAPTAACDPNAQRIDLDSVIFDHPNAIAAHVESISLRDCLVRTPSLPNLDCRHAKLKRVEITDGKLTGIGLTGAELTDLRATNCKLDLARLFDARLERCLFESCDLRELYIESGRLSRVTLRDCDLRGANLAGARLESIDLRGSLIDGASLPSASLRSITIDPTQAVAIAELMGVRVEPSPG